MRFSIALRAAGDAGLAITGKLENAGTADVDLILTGDGSSFGKRNPSVRFELTPNDVANPGSCGMINAMEDSDFVHLKPHEARTLEWLFPPTPGARRRYTLRATYRNDPAAPQIGSGAPHPPTAAQLEKVARTVPCEVTSNALAFDWDGKRATAAGAAR